MKKVAFYGRYSSANQTEQSIEGQLHVCEQYAAANDLQIVRQYIDRAQSGKTAKRREFQRMITDSESGLFEGILVYKLDRFARNRFDSVVYKRQLLEHGVRVISATEMITDTPEGIIMESVLEGMDEYYSAELARKMHRGLQESFNKGKFIGRVPPYGYRIVEHRLALDDERAPIAAEIFRRYAAGEKYMSIVDWLNSTGIRNSDGNDWKKYNIAAILKSSVYVGEYTRSDMEGVQPCPALIDRETFDRVQERLANFAHITRENRDKNFRYILSGRLICGSCGKHIGGSTTTNRAGKYHYYRCANCRGTNHPAEKLHARVMDALAEYLTDDRLDELAAAAFAEYKAEQKMDERPLLESELRDVEKQLQNAVQAILRGVDLDTLTVTIDELKARREALHEAIANAATPLPEFTLEQFRYILEHMAEKSEAEIFNTFVNQIILHEDTAIICINLTNKANTPPLEQFLCKVGNSSPSPTIHKISFSSGWLLIAA